METEQEEKTQYKYSDVYKGVYNKREIPQNVIWQECLNCDKEFPGRKFMRLCHMCTMKIRHLDQSVYRYEI